MSKRETKVVIPSIRQPQQWFQNTLNEKSVTKVKISAIPPNLFSETFLQQLHSNRSSETTEDCLNAAQILEVKRKKRDESRNISAIKRLNLDALENIVNTTGCKFNPENNRFSFENDVYHLRTTDELNQAAKAMELFSEIGFQDILALCDVLYDDPYFAAYTDIGSRIYKIIKEWPISMTFDEPFYYRARIVDGPSDIMLMHDMMMAPEGIPSQGRFNEYGRSRFYFTDTPEGAISEVVGHRMQKDKYVIVARLKPVEGVKLIDLSKAVSSRNCFVTALRKSVIDENAKVKKEYFLPNYVAGCCRAAGLDGIKYRGNGYSSYVTWTDAKLRLVDYQQPVKIEDVKISAILK